MDLVITVKEIKGHCPVHKLGDSFTLKVGYQLVSDIPVCMHALASLMPFYNALRVSELTQWGLEARTTRPRPTFSVPTLQRIQAAEQ